MHRFCIKLWIFTVCMLIACQLAYSGSVFALNVTTAQPILTYVDVFYYADYSVFKIWKLVMISK